MYLHFCRFYLKEFRGSRRWLLFLEGKYLKIQLVNFVAKGQMFLKWRLPDGILKGMSLYPVMFQFSLLIFVPLRETKENQQINEIHLDLLLRSEPSEFVSPSALLQHLRRDDEGLPRHDWCEFLTLVSIIFRWLVLPQQRDLWFQVPKYTPSNELIRLAPNKER